MHTFTPLGLVTWLPQAITWVKSGRDRLAAERFLFTTKYWSQIIGWLAFPASILIATMAMDLYIAGGTNKEYHLLSPHIVGRGRGGGGRRNRNSYDYYEEEDDYWGWSGNWWWSDWVYDDEWDTEDENEYILWVGGQVIGIFIISIEIASWIMFYVAYKGSVKYGNYLVTLQSTTSDESF